MARAAIYARISITKDESVSVERQLESATAYCAARGWEVAATFVDDGVSASHTKPEDRAKWSALLASPESFDRVVIWKVDRLARRVLDFLNADEALQERGAGIVAVEDPIDMSTPQGRAFATMLAVFAEMEAAAISARVKAARTHLVRAGRVVGGTVPYGWRSRPNPAGPGYVLEQDPERIDTVREIVRRTRAGRTIYSTVQWLNEAEVPSRSGKPWAYTTVEGLLRHPILAGMVPFNPGNSSRARGTEVLRDADGLPVVNSAVALLTPVEWRSMLAALDRPDDGRRKPRALRSKTSALLSGLVLCGEHLDDDGEPTRMHRGTTQGRASYSCPICHQTVSRLDEYVERRFLEAVGGEPRWSRIEEVEDGGAALLPEIEQRLRELGVEAAQVDDEDEADRIAGAMAVLRARRREARAEAPRKVVREVRAAGFFADEWAAATDDAERREVLDDAVAAIWIVRGRAGGPRLDERRVVVEWQPTVATDRADPTAEEIDASIQGI